MKETGCTEDKSSALVPIVQTEIEAEKVSALYGRADPAGPLRAMWMKNPSPAHSRWRQLQRLESEEVSQAGTTDS